MSSSLPSFLHPFGQSVRMSDMLQNLFYVLCFIFFFESTHNNIVKGKDEELVGVQSQGGSPLFSFHVPNILTYQGLFFRLLSFTSSGVFCNMNYKVGVHLNFNKILWKEN